MKEINEENVIAYLKKKGQHGKLTVDYLLNNADVNYAMNTTLGREILKYLVAEYEELFLKIINQKNSPEETIKFRIMRDIIFRLSQKITDYSRRLDEITKEGEVK